ncbi:MAG: DUF1877 family protein [Tetrasphaera sp.]
MIWVGYCRDEAELRQLAEYPDGFAALLESDDDAPSVDLDKAWHGIHWLLTGSAEPTGDVLSDAIFGGRQVGDDLGYGPARVLTVDRVAAVAAAMARIDPATFGDDLDPSAAEDAEVYPRRCRPRSGGIGTAGQEEFTPARRSCGSSACRVSRRRCAA